MHVYREQEQKKLSENPQVFHVDWMHLQLWTEYRIRLFKLWKKEGKSAVLTRMQLDDLDEDLVGNEFIKTMIDGFVFHGYPMQSVKERNAVGKIEDPPLIRSGRFYAVRGGTSIDYAKDFERELYRIYPEVPVKEGIKLAGVDPLDVGMELIEKIESRFKRKKAEEKSLAEWEREGAGKIEAYDVDIPFLRDHPYVKQKGEKFFLTGTFFDEASFLESMGIDPILGIYRIKSGWISGEEKARMKALIGKKEKVPAFRSIQGELHTEIARSREKALSRLVAEFFEKIRFKLPGMKIEEKRVLCKWISRLPADPWGFYTRKRILEKIGLSRSVYYEILRNKGYGLRREERFKREEEDLLLIKRVYEDGGYRKGVRQIQMQMEAGMGRNMSLNRIRYLMRKNGLQSGIRKAKNNRKGMQELMEKNKKPNILMRRFRLHHPGEVCLTDVTYLDYGRYRRGYGSAAIDPVTGKLYCFVVSGNNDQELVMETLNGIRESGIKSGGIIHSDQGTLYFLDKYQDEVNAMGLIQSMSERGVCWDNAPVESFFGHFKDECDYEGCETIEELRSAVHYYSVYYNHTRRLWEHGKMTPVEYEAYLNGLAEDAWEEHLKEEEKRYDEMVERAASLARKKAERNKAMREEALKKREEMRNEDKGKGQI